MKGINFVKGMMLCLALVTGTAQAQRYVCMESNVGKWCLELLPQYAPITVANFLNYVNQGLYDNTIVHRSANGTAYDSLYLIQGGGYSLGSDATFNLVKTFAPIPLEFSTVLNVRGVMAMARVASDDNSATSQWFINTGDNVGVLSYWSDNYYAPFARVVRGMDVIDKINALPIVNVSADQGLAFMELPVILSGISLFKISKNTVVVINKAYALDSLAGLPPDAYHCSTTIENETLTELCNGSVTFPVWVDHLGLYEVNMQLVSTQPQVVLTLKTFSTKQMDTSIQETAEYDPDTKTLVIPSVRIGTTIYKSLVFKLTDVVSQSYTLQDYSRQ
ncbi:MAG TPA: peptidylprolyl isomerase [Candidatus Acidoferrum sp.]|nr:peptidylprolyl isomerase [Candidatus Acidoferrum sp.]